MFIGHFALGLAAKRAVPGVSLAALLGAAQFADLLWPVLVAVGVEQVRIDPGNTAVTPLDFVSYPYSHSLVMLVVWGAIVGWLCQRATGTSGRTFAVVFGLVVSHWVLDVITHRPDMPLYPGGGPKFGLGLWNSAAATAAVEVPMYALGVWMYLGATRARDRIGRWAFGSMAAFLAVVYGVNLMGMPPPSVAALSAAAIGAGIVGTLWSWWADRHRVPVA